MEQLLQSQNYIPYLIVLFQLPEAIDVPGQGFTSTPDIFGRILLIIGVFTYLHSLDGFLHSWQQQRSRKCWRAEHRSLRLKLPNRFPSQLPPDTSALYYQNRNCQDMDHNRRLRRRSSLIYSCHIATTQKYWHYTWRCQR